MKENCLDEYDGGVLVLHRGSSVGRFLVRGEALRLLLH
jgi:hypothetical protein